MHRRTLPWKAIPPVAIAGSQLGHLLVYSARLGPAAVPSPAPGSHAYLPGLVTVLAGLIGGLAVFVLAVLAAARMLSADRTALGTRGPARPSILDLAALLFASQVAIFALQETAESLVATQAGPSAPAILLWGALGQLPVALLAALALSWLSAGVSGALTELSRSHAAAPLALGTAPVAVLAAGPGRPAGAQSPGRVRSQRAPPPDLR